MLIGYIGGLNTMKKLINGERYNQEIAMHTEYHLQITATEAAYLVSGGTLLHKNR